MFTSLHSGCTARSPAGVGQVIDLPWTWAGPRPALLRMALAAGFLALAPSIHGAESTPSAPDLAANPSAVAGSLNPALPTLFIAGDSTAARADGNPIQGWGVPFADYFDPAKVNIANRARGGRSSRTFITEGLWDQLLAEMKAGDFVLIQFGHNDGGAINEEPPGSTRPLRARGSLPGIGDETQAIDNIVTKKPEVVHTFGWYVRKMIADVQAKGATPVVLSLTLRNIWRDGRVERGSGRFRQWDRQIADGAGVAFVDLSRILADAYQKLGESGVQELFGPDQTHTNAAGADFNAAAVVAGLKGLRRGPFTALLSASGEAVEADGIGWLNLPEPVDASLPTVMIIGDSTARNGRGDGSEGGLWGWGDPFADLFDPATVNIVNRAVGGTSSRTFITLGYWERVRTLLKSGDMLLIQFAHNDTSPVNDDRRARGTLAGIGDETEAIHNLLTNQPEIVHTYGWYLRQMVNEARSLGVKPILVTPTLTNTWTDGQVGRGPGGGRYADWTRALGEAENLPIVDLTALATVEYHRLGEAGVQSFFNAGDRTHTNAEGAALNARLVRAGLRALPRDSIGAWVRP